MLLNQWFVASFLFISFIPASAAVDPPEFCDITKENEPESGVGVLLMDRRGDYLKSALLKQSSKLCMWMRVAHNTPTHESLEWSAAMIGGLGVLHRCHTQIHTPNNFKMLTS